MQPSFVPSPFQPHLLLPLTGIPVPIPLPGSRLLSRSLSRLSAGGRAALSARPRQEPRGRRQQQRNVRSAGRQGRKEPGLVRSGTRPPAPARAFKSDGTALPRRASPGRSPPALGPVSPGNAARDRKKLQAAPRVRSARRDP